MSHEIEQQTDGTWSFVAAREPAWHKLGKVYEGATGLTLEQVLADLNVGKLIERPVGADIYDSPTLMYGNRVVMPGKKMIIRQRTIPGQFADDFTPLGIVGDDYAVIPEREAFGFLDAVVDSGEALFQTAMLLKGGTRAAAVMKFPSGVLVGGVDPIDLFLSICTSHDGSLALTAFVTPIRVVCQNTLTWGLQAAVQKWSVRHTKHASAKLKAEEARRNLDLSYAYLGEWAEEAERLLAVEMTKLQFEQIVEKLYAPKTEAPAKATQTVWEQTHDTLMGLWDAPTQENVKGTAWAGLNALTEYHDWYRGVRQPGDDETAYRFERAFTEGASPDKNKIHALVKQFAGV